MDTGPTRQMTRQEGCQLKSCVAANSGFCGPDFLYKEESSWPEQQNVVTDVLEDDPEVKKEAKTAVVTTEADGENDVLGKLSVTFRFGFI